VVERKIPSLSFICYPTLRYLRNWILHQNVVLFCTSLVSWQDRPFASLRAPSYFARDLSIAVGRGYEGSLSLLHRYVQTGSGVHPASCPMGIGDSFAGGKAAGTWG
jgi:hypothetical protein